MEELKKKIKSGKTSWIRSENKETLLILARDLGILTINQNINIEELRKLLRTYVKTTQKHSLEESLRINMANILPSSLDNFSGGNWNSYYEQLNCYMLLHDISEEKKVPMLLTKLSSNVYENVSGLCSPLSPIKLTYEELCEKLNHFYHPKTNVAMFRAKFKDRKQEPSESIKDYMLALRKMTRDCAFTDVNEQLKERLLNGVHNETIRYELLKIAEKSLNELVLTAETAEMAYNLAHKDTSKTVEMFALKTNSKPQFKYSSKINQNQTSTSGNKCFCCGKVGHMRSQCSLRNKYCSECGQKGHIFRVCSRKNTNVKTVLVDQVTSQSEEVEETSCIYSEKNDKFHILNVQTRKKVPSIYLKIKINSILLDFEVDTGSDITTINISDKNKYFPNLKLEESYLTMINYNQTISKPIGILGSLFVVYDKVSCHNLSLVVVPDGPPRIIGKDWLSHLKLWPLDLKQNVNMCKLNEDQYISKIKNDFSAVFEPGWGNFKKASISLKLKANTIPKFLPARSVPFSLKSKVDNEIQRLLENGRIAPIEFSEWGTPVVPVLKSDGSVRLCGDYKITLNPHLVIDHFPLPTINQILANFENNDFFCELDLKEAYLQAPLNEQSQKLTTIVTEKGIFKYLYLPYGVSTGPGSFQRLIVQLLSGLKGVVVYIDNIYIAGNTLEETNRRLRSVLECIAEAELKLKINKCKFFKQSLKVFGYHVSKEGIKVIKDNIEPLLKLPKPNNLKMLRSFIGKINYYNRFLKNMAIILKPLYDCLKNDCFCWNSECDVAFKKIKEQLANTTTLAHYSNDLPIILSCDASECGVAAVLSVRTRDKIVKPVAFASKKLNDRQIKYPTIEKEALAIIFGVTKFYEYLFARTFELETDNAALVRIFGPKKGIPKMACKRLQHWAIFLSGFNYCIRHINSKNNPADFLSRNPIDDKTNFKHPLLDNSEVSVLNYLSLSNFESVNWKDIVKETAKCTLLSTVMRYCIDGWPDKNKLSEKFRPFSNRKNELTIDQGCLLWGYRVVIPECLQNLIMNELHSSHFGTNRMKQIARSYFWWPTIDKDISNITVSCLICLENRDNPEKALLSTWPCSESVWERLHADFLGPIYGKMFLVIVDSYSKWPEAFMMSNITACKTISIFKDLYSRFGYPLHLVVDNGTTWTSNEFKEFCNVTGVRISYTPPYYPATNGAAERFVQTFKSHVKKIVESGHNLEYAINLFLFDYRTSINRITGVSPAKLLFRRELRSRFSLLRPPPISARLQMLDEKLKKCSRGSRSVIFSVGEKVMVRDYRNKAKKWICGEVKQCLTPGVTYMIEVQGRLVKRHVNQMLKCAVTIEGE